MTSKKRKRQPGPSGRGGARPAVILGRNGRPIPEWKWRTFPVYFALSVGLLIGYFFGVLAAVGSIGQIASLVILAMFSLGLAHVMTRYVAGLILRRRARRVE